VTSRILVVVASITLFISGLAVWVARQALDTDEWVETSSALVRDPEVQKATAAYLGDEIVKTTDLETRVEDALPQNLQALAGPLTGVLGDVAQRASLRALQSGAFQTLWEEAQRRAHEQLVEVVDGDAQQVYLDLRPMLGQVAVRIGLGPQVASRLESQQLVGRIEVLQEDEVSTIRRAGRALKGIAWVLALVSIALLFAAVWTAQGRRRQALLHVGIGIAVAGLALLVLRRVLGSEIVDTLASGGASQPAAQSTYDISTSLLREIARTFVVLGLVLMIAAWFAGPSRLATRARVFLTPTLRDHPGLAYAALGALLLLFLLSGWLPASGRLFGLVIYVGLLIAGVSALRRQVLAEADESGGPPAAGGPSSPA
jgi:hypothetical protein